MPNQSVEYFRQPFFCERYRMIRASNHLKSAPGWPSSAIVVSMYLTLQRSPLTVFGPSAESRFPHRLSLNILKRFQWTQIWAHAVRIIKIIISAFPPTTTYFLPFLILTIFFSHFLSNSSVLLFRSSWFRAIPLTIVMSPRLSSFSFYERHIKRIDIKILQKRRILFILYEMLLFDSKTIRQRRKIQE